MVGCADDKNSTLPYHRQGQRYHRLLSEKPSLHHRIGLLSYVQPEV